MKKFFAVDADPSHKGEKTGIKQRKNGQKRKKIKEKTRICIAKLK